MKSRIRTLMPDTLTDAWKITAPDGDGFVWLNAEGGWLPIETAPRDGTRILLYWPEGIWVDACEANDWGGTTQPYTAEGWADESGFWKAYYAMPPHGNPTHWMPRPADPGAGSFQMINLGEVADVREKLEQWLGERGRSDG